MAAWQKGFRRVMLRIVAELKLRPFSERFHRGSMLPILVISGEIAGTLFVVQVDHARFKLPTFAIAEDQLGAYVLLSEFNCPVPGGLCLCLRAQRIGEAIVGAELSLEEAAEANGEEVKAGHFTVFFSPTGEVDGQGLVRYASEHPIVLH